ncbi:MAG: hypothetical protein IE883_05390 [Epsilonproteobacteria bacterium]|nr:hypothetical protein [Campylobacterota bacterium]
MIDFSPLKARLLLDYPFFGTIVSGMESIVNDNIESFATKGGKFEYRESFMESLSEGEQIFALCNSALHEALSHTQRRGNRSPWLWNMACDYAINALLIENGFTPPPTITYDKRFGNLSAEEIYHELSQEFLDQEQNDRDSDEGRIRSILLSVMIVSAPMSALSVERLLLILLAVEQGQTLVLYLD